MTKEVIFITPPLNTTDHYCILYLFDPTSSITTTVTTQEDGQGIHLSIVSPVCYYVLQHGEGALVAGPASKQVPSRLILLYHIRRRHPPHSQGLLKGV